MRVRRLSAVLVFSVLCGIHDAAAAPIVIADPLTPFSASGELGSYNDVKLFTFDLGPGAYVFTAQTTSYTTADDPLGGFDPNLALYGPDGTIVTYGDPAVPARNDDRDPGVDFNSYLSFDLVVAAGPVATFTLALTQTFNNAHESALEFDWDALSCAQVASDLGFTEAEFCVAAGGFIGPSPRFSLDLNIDPDVAGPSVPEPGTLSLLALGSVCIALVRRRHARTVARQLTSQGI